MHVFGLLLVRVSQLIICKTALCAPSAGSAMPVGVPKWEPPKWGSLAQALAENVLRGQEKGGTETALFNCKVTQSRALINLGNEELENRTQDSAGAK